MAAMTLTIEIGNDYIKVCVAQKHKGKSIIVHNALSIPTPEGSFEDGNIKDKGAVANAIKEALQEERIEASSATFVMASAKVASKEVMLPKVKNEKLREMIHMNASDYFPVNIDDYILSYTVLENIITKEAKQTRVLVYAAPERIVKGYYDLAGLLNMKVKALDYSGNSTLQLLKMQIDDKPNLVIQIGMDATIVSILDKHILKLQRTVPYGESLLLNSVMADKKVTDKVALELLSSAQIVKDSLDRDEVTGSLKYLINNVNRIIEYYSSRNQESPLQKAYIIGEGSDVLGLDTLFTNETNLRTERLTILKNVESYNRIKISVSVLKQYMSNIGASINPINFKTRDAEVVTQKLDTTKTPRIVCLACIGISIVLVGYAFFNQTMKKNEIKDLEDQISNVEIIESIIQEHNQLYDELADVGNFYLETVNSNETLVNYLEEMEKKMPKRMSFSSITSASGSVTIIGQCENKNDAAFFIEGMKELDFVSSVNMSSVSDMTPSDGENVVSFTCQITFNITHDEIFDGLNISDEEKAYVIGTIISGADSTNTNANTDAE